MAPLPGVCLLRGDITSRDTVNTIIEHFEGEKVDLVVSDGAPDVTGMHDLDENMQSQLLLACITLAAHVLRPDSGIFVAKIFKSSGYSLLAAQCHIFFKSVQCIKPASSRAKSAEHFIVCKQFKLPPGYKSVFDQTPQKSLNEAAVASPAADAAAVTVNALSMPFLHSGDLQPHDALPQVTEEETKKRQENAKQTSFTRFLQQPSPFVMA